MTPLPVWVRIADGLAACFVALAAWGALTGGSRTIVAGVVLSTRSPLVFLYAAASVLILRHLLVARPSTIACAREVFDAVARRPVFAAALRAFLFTRPTVLVVGFIAVATIGLGRPGFFLSDDPAENLPGRFDAGWYGGIAVEGYSWDHTFQRQRNIAFFPAAPMLMRPLGAVFGMHDPSAIRERRMVRALWAGVVMSLAAFLWAMYYFVRLAGDVVGEARASDAALLLAAYPFALFYSAPYSEAMFLLGAVATTVHFRRDEWMRAACWGVFTGLTRPNAFFLTVPLALIAMGRFTGLRVDRAPSPPDRSARTAAMRLAVAATPVIGMLTFTLYLYSLTGVWFAWARSHEAWGRTFHALEPLAGLGDALRQHSLLELFVQSPFNGLNTIGLVFACAMVWPVVRRVGAAWGLYVLVNVIPPFLAGGVLSQGRLSSTLFPLFLALAAMIPARRTPAVVTMFGIGQGLCAALFFTWRELY